MIPTGPRRPSRSKSNSKTHHPAWWVYVVLVGGVAPDRPRSFRLHSSCTEVGRADGCQIRIDRSEDISVSNQHAALRRERDHRLVIEDLGSSHGTFVNGERLPPKSTHTLADTDVIAVGDTVLIVRLDTDEALGDPDPEAHGVSRCWLRVLRDLERIARTDDPVLLLGETGAGKNVLADFIHRVSGRKGLSLKLNVGDVAPTMIAAELFGHAKGGFTGADSNREGLFETARDGTLLLDEIGELPLADQPKLLHAAQFREFCPVGSSMPRRHTARIIAATHRDLKAEVEAGRFREDLYHRLAPHPVEVPPLRDRPEDVLYLLSEMLRAQRPNIELVFDVDFAVDLIRFGWPGNVRQLWNLSLVLRLCPSRPFAMSDVPEAWQRDLTSDRSSRGKRSFDVEQFRQLVDSGASQRMIEKAMKMPRRTLVRKADEAGVAHPWSGDSKPASKRPTRV